MPGPNRISLPSGITIESPWERLLQFCREEYDYYDGITSGDPNRIEPVDILATVAMNSYVNNAAAVRAVHRGMAERCERLLSAIPMDADLLTFDPTLKAVGDLLHAAIQTPRVLIPVATKVLHRKRRRLIPMLDNVVLGYYLRSPERRHLGARTQAKDKAAEVAVEVMRTFRDDLLGVRPDLDELCGDLAKVGYQLSAVRALELLIWMEVESAGYYRGLVATG